MSNRGKRGVVWAVAFVATLAIAGSVSAVESQFANDRRWIPSVGLSVGFTVHEQEASFESSCRTSALWRPEPDEPMVGACQGSTPNFLGARELRPSEEGASQHVSPLVGVSAQLASPVIPKVPGRFRAFVSGEVLVLFSPTRAIAREGQPSSIGGPDGAEENIKHSQNSLTGVGTSADSEYGQLAYRLDLGLIYPFEALGRHFRLKPSVGWARWEFDLDGRLAAGLKDDYDPAPGATCACGANRRDVYLESSETLTLNGIGPGLELEMDALRFGQFGVGLFMGGNAYKVLGNRKANLQATVAVTGDALQDNTYDASWSYKADPWMYRVAVGIRLHFLGD